MRKLVLWLSVLGIVGVCVWFSNARTAHAASIVVWQVGANCEGVTNTPDHSCEFIKSLFQIAPYDQWNIAVVAPSTVTGVTCQTFGPNIFQYMGAFNDNKANPWEGSHYGNVGICRGWTNGGNGPVKIIVNYQ